MPELTFGEQVKIVLKRRNMTIKELAERIEAHTGKKMSRQNLTQRLSRDNFQEQDMRMIAEILHCPLQLSILGETVAAVQPASAGQPAAAPPVPVSAGQPDTAAPPAAVPSVSIGQPAAAPPVSIGQPAAAAPVPVSAGQPATAPPVSIGQPAAAPPVPVSAGQPAAAAPAAPPASVERLVPAAPQAEYEESEKGAWSAESAYTAEEPKGFSYTAEEPRGFSYAAEEPRGFSYAAKGAGGFSYTVEEPDEFSYIEEESGGEEREEALSDMPGADKGIDYKSDYTVEELLAEVEALEAEAKESRRTFPRESREKQHGWKSYLHRNRKNESARTRRDSFSDSLYNDYPEEEEDDDIQIFDIDYEPGEELYITEGLYDDSYVDDEEDTEIGDANPYTGREYRTNSVRMHPDRIGYVQVYDRADHRWTDMTEWAFLGYQERKKALLGDDYEPPIYLD